MRFQAYRLFEIVAWPAVAWCVAEAGLRGAAGYSHAFSETALLGACAALTIVACRWRSHALAHAPITRERS